MGGVHDIHELNDPKNDLVDQYGCFGDQFVFDVLLDGILQVAQAMANTLYFNFVWTTSVAHDVPGNTRYMDNPTFDLLLNLREKKLTNGTVIFFFSDHGISFGEYSKTEIGTVESLMPLLYVVLPDWFRNKYQAAVENMKLNAKRLTTPYDIYETLKDIADLSRITDSNLGRRRVSEKRKLGQSLFLPLPVNRTCEMANIPPEWCICWDRSLILEPKINGDVMRGAQFAMDWLNAKLKNYPLCDSLELSKIISATKLTSRVRGGATNNYEVTFQALPGEAEFKAMLSMELTSSELNLVGEVTRVNKYEKQSLCVAAWDNATYIKTICFCKVRSNH